MAETRDTQPVSLREARKADTEALYRWRTDPQGEAASPPTRREHDSWFKKLRHAPDSRVLLVRTGEVSIGYIQADRRGEVAELWIYIALEFRGRGFGSAAIDAAVSSLRLEWGVRRATAVIGEGNAPAVATFRAAGFREESREGGRVILSRQLAGVEAEEITRAKARAWSTPEAAKRYEKGVYRKRGVTLAKNIVESRYARRFLRGHILDAGAGTGRFSLDLERMGCRVVAADISHSMLGIALRKSGGRVRAVQADLLRLPFRDATFDGAVSITVLEHLPPYREALAEIVRVVRPGAFVVVQFRSAEHSARAGNPRSHGALEFLAELDGKELSEVLRDAGLERILVAPYGFLNASQLLPKWLGRAAPLATRSLDFILRLPLAARLLAAVELGMLARSPLWTCASMIVVGRKRRD